MLLVNTYFTFVCTGTGSRGGYIQNNCGAGLGDCKRTGKVKIHTNLLRVQCTIDMLIYYSTQEL
jgi:hypothetical protein